MPGCAAGDAAGARAGVGALLVGRSKGTLPQPASIPTIKAAHHQPKELAMTLLLLEALGAGILFIGIIWWTMFSGRPDGDPPAPEQVKEKDKTS
jgi:hypothetical protein